MSAGLPVGDRFGNPHDAGGPTAADLVLSAQLDAEVAVAAAARARIQLLSVRVAAEGVLRQWPDGAYLQMDYSDHRYDRRGAVAILDADGGCSMTTSRRGPGSTMALICTD